MSLVSFGDSDEELDSSDVQSDVEPLLQQHHDSSHPRVRVLKATTSGSPKARNGGSLGPAGRQYRLTNLAAGTGITAAGALDLTPLF